MTGIVVLDTGRLWDLFEGRTNDPLHRARRDLTRAREHLTERAQARLDAAFAADRDYELERAWTSRR